MKQTTLLYIFTKLCHEQQEKPKCIICRMSESIENSIEIEFSFRSGEIMFKKFEQIRKRGIQACSEFHFRIVYLNEINEKVEFGILYK